MEEQFEYVMKVSGGWSQVRLTLADDNARIEYTSASMGQIPVWYILHCQHEKLSDFHGLLSLLSMEQHQAVKNEFGGHIMSKTSEPVNIGLLIDPDADEGMLDVLNWFYLEYVRFQEPQLRLDEQGGNWGVHERPETFNLILLIHDAGFWRDESTRFETTPLGRGLAHLDKMHFAIAQGKFSIPW